jgi:hypothetical protein
MSCLLCASGNHGEFGSEIVIHFRGLKNLDKPTVWLFPKLSVCLDADVPPFRSDRLGAIVHAVVVGDFSQVNGYSTRSYFLGRLRAHGLR